MGCVRTSVFQQLICLLVFLFLSGQGCTDDHPQTDSRPNIILIVTDDQDADSVRFMRNLQDRIISKGVTFTNAFVTSSWCAPSRGSILTGQYPHRSRVVTGYRQLRAVEQNTIAPLLKQAGYTNIFIGKYMNGYGETAPEMVPPGWDEWYALVDENTYYDYRMNENGNIVRYGNSEGEYVSDVLADKSLDFLTREQGDRHFFMYINTVAPHDPAVPAIRHRKQCRDMPPLSMDFETDLSDKPAWVRDYRDVNEELIERYFGNQEKMTKRNKQRCRSLVAVDEMIEKIVVNLERSGVLQNSYIIFLSDNGDGLSRHIPVSPKLSPYDEGIRVPFVVTGPGVPEGKQVPHLVSTVDILPTLAEIAGVPAFAGTDGRSFLPLLQHESLPESSWREGVFAELVAHRGDSWPWKSSPPAYQLIRGSAFKYIEYDTGEREYYDLINDPQEMDNIYNLLAPETKKELSRRLEKLSRGG